MKCPYCGRVNDNDADTCEYCGRSLVRTRREQAMIHTGALIICVILLVGTIALVFVTRALDTSKLKETSGGDGTESAAVGTSAVSGSETAVSTGSASSVSTSASSAEESGETSGPVTASLADADQIQQLSGYEQVSVASADATSWVEANDGSDIYNPSSAVDGDDSTSWQEGASGAGEGETLTLTLDQEHEIRYIAIKPGSWRTEASFTQNNRPSGITVSIGGQNFDVDLEDRRTEQYILLSGDVKADTITITIRSAYEGTNNNDTCIAEVSVFGK